jgi:hypothetical protein
MKIKTFLLAAALMMGTQYGMAQNKMMATEVSNRLMLNEATSAKFIPVYESYLKAMEELRAKYAPQGCCEPREEGRGPRPEGMRDDRRRDDKKGPRHDRKDAPKPDMKDAPKSDGQPAPKGDAPKEGCQKEGGCQGPKVLTDAEVEKQVKDRIALMRDEADLQEKYYKELRSILTPLQIVRVLDFGAKAPEGPAPRR